MWKKKQRKLKKIKIKKKKLNNCNSIYKIKIDLCTYLKLVAHGRNGRNITYDGQKVGGW